MTLITLTPQEREGLEERAAHTQHADELRRAQAWRWLDSGERVPEVAARLRVTRQTSSNGVERFKLRTARHLLGRLAGNPRRGRPRTAHGIIAPLLLEVIDRDPRERGSRATIWTAPRRTSHLEARSHLRVSRKSVSLAVARLGLRWKRPRHDVARRPATGRQAKGDARAAWRRGRARSS
jgi:transposase